MFNGITLNIAGPTASSSAALQPSQLNCDYLAMMAEMQQKIEEFGGKGAESNERSLYPFFFSQEEQKAILERLLAEDKD